VAALAFVVAALACVLAAAAPAASISKATPTITGLRPRPGLVS
jgi:uncharacterized protein (DUF2141 family)